MLPKANVKDTPRIATPAQRRKLPVDKSPLWLTIGSQRSGLKLGYRKGAKGGVWVAKLVTPDARLETTLGPADDDGCKPGALSQIEAQAAAIKWADDQRRKLAQGTGAPLKPLTVEDAVTDYIKDREKRSGRNSGDAKSRLTLHVLSDKKLSGMSLANLSSRALSNWRGKLSGELAPATVNRLLNDFRAALRASVEKHWRELPSTIGKEIELGLKALPEAETARHALMNDADVRLVIDSAYRLDADFGALVLVLAATGARFSQVARIEVKDVQPEAGRIMVPASGKGKGVKARKSIPVPVGDDVLTRVKPLLAGRKGHKPLLLHWISQQVGPAQWEAVRRDAWASSAHMQRPWKKALDAAGLEPVEPYALRHSSIVRGLRAGVPVRIVAALHDTSTAMIEKHYSAYILDMADELARKALTPLVSAAPSPLKAVG
jgi:integrase